MISALQAIVLGIVQGLTEFLPVSSSGHLVLLQILFGLKEPPLLYDVLLHGATLIAIVVILWDPSIRLFRASFRLLRTFPRFVRNREKAIREDPDAWQAVLIWMATAITGVIGVGFHHQLEDMFQSVAHLSFWWMVTGVILWMTRRNSLSGGRKIEEMRIQDGLWIGLAQAAAIIPSLSRSGTTIAVALLLGLDRKLAGEFSFLLAIPAIGGAVLLESSKGFSNLQVEMGPAIVGCILSFVFGAVSLKYLLGWIRSGKLTYFAYYCWALSLFSAWLFFRT